MIPKAYITEWRNTVSWPDDFQIEQDLILNGMIIELYSYEQIQKELAFRGK